MKQRRGNYKKENESRKYITIEDRVSLECQEQ